MKSRQSIQPFIFILVLTAFVYHCNNKSSSKDKLPNLFGNWRWIESVGGIDGSTRTPSTEGHTIVISFDKNGTYKEMIAGKEETKKEYSIITSSPRDEENPYLIQYSDGKTILNIRQYVSFTGKDTLHLRDNCDDCFSHTYVREK